MAEMIAKGLVGDTMDQVTGAFGGGEKKDGDDEIAAARKLEEEKRKEKHRKMEEEREKVRQQIRDKYNLKKKDPADEAANKYARKGNAANKTSDNQDDVEQDDSDQRLEMPSSKGSSKSGKCLIH